MPRSAEQIKVGLGLAKAFIKTGDDAAKMGSSTVSDIEAFLMDHGFSEREIFLYLGMMWAVDGFPGAPNGAVGIVTCKNLKDEAEDV